MVGQHLKLRFKSFRSQLETIRVVPATDPVVEQDQASRQKLSLFGTLLEKLAKHLATMVCQGPPAAFFLLTEPGFATYN